jgi:hypothetical protein
MLVAVGPSPYQSCPRPTIAVAPREPYVTRGPTEVVVGLYVQGGAFIPACHNAAVHGPEAGTVTVRARGGTIAAQETLQGTGKLFALRVEPGSYTISARFAGGVRVPGLSVTVRRGYTTRHDLFEDVP